LNNVSPVLRGRIQGAFASRHHRVIGLDQPHPLAGQRGIRRGKVSLYYFFISK
jgi:hypothetical protein